MIRIQAGCGERITQSGRCLLKGDAVLREVLCSLRRVPFEFQLRATLGNAAPTVNVQIRMHAIAQSLELQTRGAAREATTFLSQAAAGKEMEGLDRGSDGAQCSANDAERRDHARASAVAARPSDGDRQTAGASGR